MTTWDEAKVTMLEGEDDVAEVAPQAPASNGVKLSRDFITAPYEPPVNRQPSLVVVEHFDFTMVDMNASGATLRVRQLSRGEALSLISRNEDADVLALNMRGQLSLERELGMEESRVPKVGTGRKILVMTYLKFSDVRWFLVEYESDGDGVID